MMAKKETNKVALYRKYRPSSWKDVLGQEAVVSVLSRSAKEGSISHAYLFSGSRGTGKTSVARIFAHEIGCSEKDLYEIDAASNRGIDDVRALREGVLSLPFESPYKVYIIDEAHMLTTPAWNAFLKTLEEPPKHAVFVLATTEPEKIPETIISRCETYSFKRPSREILAKMVAQKAKEEGSELEASAAELIATLADGSYRDAYGILQKVISGNAEKKVSVEAVAKLTGAPKTQLLNDFLTALAEGDLDGALGAVHTAESQNLDMHVFAKLALERLRAVLMSSMAPQIGKEMRERYSPDDADFLEALSKKEGNGITLDLLRELLGAVAEMPRAYIPALTLELALARALDTD